MMKLSVLFAISCGSRTKVEEPVNNRQSAATYIAQADQLYAPARGFDASAVSLIAASNCIQQYALFMRHNGG